METKSESKSGRVGVSLSKETAEMLIELRDHLSGRIGFKPSLTQVVEYLVSTYNRHADK
jgi:hypothetical protein